MDLSGDVLQVGLTEDADDKLRLLRAEKSQYFAEDADVYRIGVAVALARGSDITGAMKRQQLKNKFRTVQESGTPGDLLPRLDSADRRLGWVDRCSPTRMGACAVSSFAISCCDWDRLSS